MAKLTVWACALAAAGACAVAENEEGDPVCVPADCTLDCHAAGVGRGECVGDTCVCLESTVPGRDADDAASDGGGADADADADARRDDASGGDADADGDARDDAGSDRWSDADSGSELACGDFLDCTSSCFDEPCVTACFDRLCMRGQTYLDALGRCVETECAAACSDGLDPEACNTCVYSSCDPELTACLDSTC